MKKLISSIILLLSFPALQAQDSLSFTPKTVLDSSLVGQSVVGIMPDGVNVIQSKELDAALEQQIQDNAFRQVNGFRIRIYFDNGQRSRTESESVLYRFQAAFPGVSTYRTFSSPYFKVTVGDYRTRSEALASLKEIQAMFPTAFIVRDTFQFPSMGE